MAVVNFYRTAPKSDGGFAPAAGFIKFTQTGRRRIAGSPDNTVLDLPFSVTFVNGLVAPDLAATGVDWVWLVEEHVKGLPVRSYAVTVPSGAGPFDDADLTVVDPRDFTPVPGATSVAGATDTAVAGFVNNSASGTRAALNVTFAGKAAQKRLAGGLYLPSEYAMLKWRALRARTLAGERQGHVAILGDSIPYGAGTGAVSSPKPDNNWPGRLRKTVTARYGDAGTGIVFAEANKLSNPTWDPRWALTGTVTNQAFGLYKSAAFRLDAVAGTYVEFTAKADTFVIYNYGGAAALNDAKVDGATVGTFRNHGGSGAPTSSLAKGAGYWVSQVVTEVPAGAYGTHTLRVTPDTTVNTNDMFLGAVEARRTVNGTFRITEAARSGMSFTDLFSGAGNNDETNGIYGLPMIDMMRADLLVIALGINDWNGGRTLASTKADLKTAIQRQRSTNAASGTIGQRAGGDVLLVWNPTPDLTTIGLTATDTYASFRDMYYTVADEENCALLDLSDRWGGYASGNALGLYADGIHPNDAGSLDIAPVVQRAIFDYA